MCEKCDKLKHVYDMAKEIDDRYIKGEFRFIKQGAYADFTRLHQAIVDIELIQENPQGRQP